MANISAVTASQRQLMIREIIQFSRLGIFWLVLILSVSFYLLQKNFLNLDWLMPIYATLSFAFIQQIILVSLSGKLKDPIILVSFVVDTLCISFFIYYSGSNQSFFMFLHLVNILIAGFYFQTIGAMIVALAASLSLTMSLIFSDVSESQNILFILGLNHISFYVVAALSGFLSAQLKETRIELVNTEKLNQAILDHLPVGVLTVQNDGRLVIGNPVVYKILGIQQLPETVNQLVPINWSEITRLIQTGNKDYYQELRYPMAQGEVKILKIEVSQFQSDELAEIIQLVLITDLTEIRKLEYRMRQSETLAAIGGLAAGIAHEIRNPLAGISGSIEMLSQSTQTEDDKKLMKIVLREIDRLNNLITEFLDFAKPESTPNEVVNLSQIVVETVASLKLNQQLNQNTLQDIQIDKDIFILGKSDKLRQALLNFFINSYQAMQNTEKPQLTVLLSNTIQGVVLKIRDNGCGMKNETRNRMFEPFHTTKPKGTGLGLAITHKILENHQAKIFVQSELGQGTEVALTFPVVKN